MFSCSFDDAGRVEKAILICLSGNCVIHRLMSDVSLGVAVELAEGLGDSDEEAMVKVVKAEWKFRQGGKSGKWANYPQF